MTEPTDRYQNHYEYRPTNGPITSAIEDGLDKTDWPFAIVDHDSVFAFGATIAVVTQGQNAEATARRIRAALNATWWMGIDALESGVVLGMLAACKLALDYTTIPYVQFRQKYGAIDRADMLDKLRAAIAKAEGR